MVQCASADLLFVLYTCAFFFATATARLLDVPSVEPPVPIPFLFPRTLCHLTDDPARRRQQRRDPSLSKKERQKGVL